VSDRKISLRPTSGRPALRTHETLGLSTSLAIAVLFGFTAASLQAAPEGGGCGIPRPCGLIREEIASPPSFLSLESGSALEDEYLVGDWDGDGCDDIAVRRGNLILMSTDRDDGLHDLEQRYGIGNGENEYLVGDWNDDGCDDLAVRRDNQIFWDANFDGLHDGTIVFGAGNIADQYVAADLNGDGLEDVSVRVHNDWERDLGLVWDGIGDGVTRFGNGNNEDEYLVGHWDPLDGTTRQTYAVRRGNDVLMNFDFDGSHDFVQRFGTGASEDEYLVGDWDGDGLDNLGVRRGNLLYLDTDFTGGHEILQRFGTGTD